MKKKIKNRIIGFFKLIYVKLVKINDTPQKIAAGFGLGVFLGILPGTGPIAALLAASFLHINRAAAVSGSLLTNTWLSFLIFPLSVKLGAVIIGLDYRAVYREWFLFLKDFHWLALFNLAVLKVILPVILGYFLISLCLGFMLYLTILLILKQRKDENKS